MKIILASTSPRRRQLLKEGGFDFEVLSIDADESYPETLPAANVPLFIANKKMDQAIESADKRDIIITADTVVILGDKIIGKPADADDAFAILRSLSGNRHTVVSAVVIYCNEIRTEIESLTHVYFEELSDEEILYYLNTFKPYDKAGAYAIQEWIGINKISKIEGDYYNVVGFPMSKIFPVLKKLMRDK